MDEIMDMADLHSGGGQGTRFRTGTRDIILMCLRMHWLFIIMENTVASNPSHEHRHVRRQIDDPVLDGEVLRVNHV